MRFHSHQAVPKVSVSQALTLPHLFYHQREVGKEQRGKQDISLREMTPDATQQLKRGAYSKGRQGEWIWGGYVTCTTAPQEDWRSAVLELSIAGAALSDFHSPSLRLWPPTREFFYLPQVAPDTILELTPMVKDI